MRMSAVTALLALGLVAQAAVSVYADAPEALFQSWQETDMLSTVAQQRSLLQTSSPATYSPHYSPSPAYSPRPSPTYSPSPSASPVSSPRPSPTTSPAPARSPKPCKFTATSNFNIYTVVIRSTRNWGAGRNSIFFAAQAVYKSYSQPTYKYFVTITGPPGQLPKKPVNDFIYVVRVPVTPCVGFKEGMRSKLRTAIKKVSAIHIKKVFFGIQQ